MWTASADRTVAIDPQSSAGIYVSWRPARHTEGTKGIVDQTTTSTTSADGTVIGWRQAGEGPPAILVHGTSGDHTDWAICSGFLEPHHTLLAVDRRGRGRSGDTLPYDFQREVKDVAAVVAALDGPPHLIGHSYGAIVALAAAHAGVPVRSLVLYEPPLLAHDMLDASALPAACETAIADGDPDRCVQTFFDAIGEGHVADLLRTIPEVWERFLRDAHTIPRELAVPPGTWSVELAEGVQAPTLLVLGTESHELFHRSIEALAQALPQAELAHLEGQGHIGHSFAPELFAQTVLDFITRH